MTASIRGGAEFGVAGYYKMVAHRVDDAGYIVSSRLLADWFPNIVTDSGLDGMGTTRLSALTSSCQVGSGDTPATATDTALESYIASSNTTASSSSLQNTSPYWRGFRKTTRFGVGEAAGNLSEVGMANESSSTPSILFSRALILDSGGSPTTITVLSNEMLDVTFEIRMYTIQSAVAWSGSVSSTGHSGDIELWTASNSDPSIASHPAGFGNPNDRFFFEAYPDTSSFGTFGDQSPNTGGEEAGAVTNNAYVGGSHERSFVATWDVDSANFDNGIHIVTVPTSYARYKVSVSPPIMKDNQSTLSLTFKVSWGRYTP